MNIVRSAAAALLVSAASATASATFNPVVFLGGDAAFNSLTDNGALERAVAEGRIGNNAQSGTWERAIWERGGVGTPITEGAFTYTSGTAYSFSVDWNGSDTVTFVQGGQSLTFNAVAGQFTDIFIRARSTTTSSIVLKDLDINGTNIPDVVSNGGGVEYVRITNSAGNMPAFSIKGTVTLSWTGSAPTNSALAYQVKFTNIIPAPATGGLLLVASLAAARRRR